MLKTLVVYSGKYGTTEDVAKTISMITGPARYCTVEDFNEDYRDFEFIVIGSAIYNATLEPSIVEFVKQNSAWLNKKVVSTFCTCLDKNNGLKLLNDLSISSGVDFLILKALGGRLILDKLDDEDHEAIEKFLESVKLPFEDMNFYNQEEVINFSLKLKELKEGLIERVGETELEEAVEDFINSHNTCSLASSYEGKVRNTPIEYNYFNKHLYMLTEGGEKFSNLLLNDNVSVSIYDPFKGMNSLAGMQITGKAVIVPEASDEYIEVLGLKGLNIETMNKLPINMNMIKILINKIEFLNSKFKKLGADTKQIIKF